MSAPIPSFFKIRCVLVILSILLFFMLVGMTRRALAECTGTQTNGSCVEYTYYCTDGILSSGGTLYSSVSLGSSCNIVYSSPVSAPAGTRYCYGGALRKWTRFAGQRSWVLSASWPLNALTQDASVPATKASAPSDTSTLDCSGDCTDEEEDLSAQCGSTGYTMTDEETCKGRCNDCVQEAEQQCEGKEIVWDEEGECSYTCKGLCEDMHDRLSHDCGGADKFWLKGAKTTGADGQSTEQCAGACGSPPDANLDTDGDGDPDSTDGDIDGDGLANDQDDDLDGDGIQNGSDSAPTVPGGIDMSKPPGAYGEENPGAPPPSTDPDRPDPTFDCIEQYNNKVKECGEAGIASWSNENCTGRCNGSNPCTKEQMDAADAACPKGYTMNSDCTSSCKTCSGFESDCIESCKPAAVKTNFCEEQNGTVVDTLCECEDASGCQQYKSSCDAACAQDNCGGVKTYQCQEDSTGKITSKTCECNDCGKPDVPDPKNPEPEDPSDLSGWLKGIKRDTEQISDNTASVKESVDGLKGSIDGLKNALSDVTTMKGSGIGTLTGDGSLGTGGSVTGSGYGTAPVELPGETSFGTFTPRASGSAGDYGGQISAKLNTLSITASGAVCSFNLSYPVPRFSGLSVSFTWQNYLADFCPYESLFVALGNILVFFTALSELYKFA